MKHLKIFENFNTEEIKRLCKDYKIFDYSINKDGTINVNHNLQLQFPKGLNKIPIKFNKIIGHFSCNHNSLNNLENCPKYIERSFRCSFNQLTTLLGGPEYVGRGYFCAHNDLKDAYGFPETFQGVVEIDYNPIFEIINLVSREKRANFIKLLNEYKVIRNGNTIIESRLLDVLSEFNINKLPIEKFIFYKLI